MIFYSAYTKSMKFVLVFGVATTLHAVHRSLSYDVTSKLRVQASKKNKNSLKFSLFLLSLGLTSISSFYLVLILPFFTRSLSHPPSQCYVEFDLLIPRVKAPARCAADYLLNWNIQMKEKQRKKKRNKSSRVSSITVRLCWSSFRYSIHKLKWKVCRMSSRVLFYPEKLHLSWPEGRFNSSQISFSFAISPYTVFFKDTR